MRHEYETFESAHTSKNLIIHSIITTHMNVVWDNGRGTVASHDILCEGTNIGRDGVRIQSPTHIQTQETTPTYTWIL